MLGFNKPVVTKEQVFLELKDYLFITFGLALYAVGVNCFMPPYQITSGGVAGIGSILFYGFGLPIAVTYFSVNVFLLILSVKIMGWRFSIKTIYGVLMLTLFLQLGHDFMINFGMTHPGEFDIIYKNMPQIVRKDAFMSTVLGASCEGIGLGIVFLSNGSTGGTDIIAAIINKYKDVTLGQVIMFVDIFIISSSILLNTVNISQLLYGYCTLIVTNILLDFVVDRGRQSVQFFIFSNKYGDIADAITSTGRNVTVLDGEGWYTHASRKVLVVLAKKRESGQIFRFIQNIDPEAFVSQSKVIGVFGYGFDRIKAKRQAKAAPKRENLPTPEEEHLVVPEWTTLNGYEPGKEK